MTNLKELLPKLAKVLVPVEGSDCSQRAVTFAGCLLAPLSTQVVEEVDLVHVLSAGYLETSAQRIDFRVEVLKETSLFQKLREEYLEEKVYPLLNWAEQELNRLGVRTSIKKQVLEGDPAKEIVNFAQKGGFQTVIMGRRGLSCLKERFLGSCSLAVCHRPGAHTTYVVGQKVENEDCPVPRILVPIDGSEHSLAALREACGLALAFGEKMERLTLFYVVDAAYDPDRLLDRLDEAKVLLKEAQVKALSFGVPEDLIQVETRVGRPANEIVAFAKEERFNIVMMGRRGLSGIKELIMGSVSSKVLHKAEDFTVALISS